MAKTSIRNALQRYAKRRIEFVLVACVVLTTCLIQAVLPHKLIAMNVLFLPTVLAAYFLGARSGGLTALFSFLIIAIYAILSPGQFAIEATPLLLALDLVIWGAILGLTGIVVGCLCDRNQLQMRDLRTAYIGVLEILTKFLEAADHYTKSHSVRVAKLSVAIAREMGLSDYETEDVRVGALLHDIGKTDSVELVKRASALDESELRQVAGHTITGADLVRSVGNVLEEAIPIILYHHHYFDGSGSHPEPMGKEIPLGARIVAVADAYDAIVTDRSYRKGRAPWQAVAEIESCAGTQFDPEVVEAFKRIFPADTVETEQDLHDLFAVGAVKQNGRGKPTSITPPDSLQTLDELSSVLECETEE